MKLLVTIIRPEQLEAVQAALERSTQCLMSVTQMAAYGKESGSATNASARSSTAGYYRGARFPVRPAKLRLEIAVDELAVNEISAAIAKATENTRSMRTGERNVFVISLEDCSSPQATDFVSRSPRFRPGEFSASR